MVVPDTDGQVLEYWTVAPPTREPRIYYVNGIQTGAQDHAQSATALSMLTERVVHGVYNATAGKDVRILLDLLQCGDDWIDIFQSKIGEWGVGAINKAVNSVLAFIDKKKRELPTDPVNVAESIRRRIPEHVRMALVEQRIANNAATMSLFRQLREYRDQRQIIVAHSQGNLITANALWAMVIAYGDGSVAEVRVYSLASPSPAWPMGIRHRRKVYGHTNDPVTLADPHNWGWITKRIAEGKFGRSAGDWRSFGQGGFQKLDPHMLNNNVALNFATTIRRELGLMPYPGQLPSF